MATAIPRPDGPPIRLERVVGADGRVSVVVDDVEIGAWPPVTAVVAWQAAVATCRRLARERPDGAGAGDAAE